MTDKTIGRNIQRLRQSRHWSQQRLAGELNVSEPAVQAWESGRNEPRLGTLKLLRRLFQVTYEEILETHTKSSGETKS